MQCSPFLTQLLAVLLSVASQELQAFQQSLDGDNVEKISFGTTIGFVPGDCYFSAKMLEIRAVAESTESATQDGLLLSYSFPKLRVSDMTLPISHGFSRAKLRGLDSQDYRMLDEFTLLLYNSSANLDLLETPRLLVVNQDFDWETSRFFVRYNEKWQTVSNTDFATVPKPAKPGCSPFPQYYQPHVNLSDAVIDDWRLGPSISSLKVEFPPTLTSERIDGRMQIVEPLSIDWNSVVLIGFPGYTHEEIFKRKFDSVFFVCSGKRISRYRWTTNKLSETVTTVLEWSIERHEIESDGCD